MKVFAVCGKLQADILIITDGTFRSCMLCIQVLCVVAQLLIMRYVFIQACA